MILVNDSLNYHQALQNENKEITYLQVAVVRSEKFQDYVSTWGKMLVIFQLPDQLPMEGENEDVGPSEGGIRQTVYPENGICPKAGVCFRDRWQCSVNVRSTSQPW